ncbi:MAG: 16S rRNA (adenine(1518)-N(6)/adenine(1519)-N(6))-dimethyltransferase RsmA [Phycisphaerales bacterium]
MQTLAQIRALLDQHGLSPKKALGQNFLIDKNLLAKLAAAAGAGAADLVLEIGPGTGTLTEALLERGCTVVACELDTGLAALLRENLSGPIASGHLRIVEGDCLGKGKRLSPEVAGVLGERAFTLVANLPYQAGTPLMIDLLLHHPRCRVLAATIQREVGERLTAKPGSRDYGLLSIVAQAMAEIEWVADLSPECFWPRPEVASCMVLLRRRAVPLAHDPDRLAAFCHTLFSKRRKQLGAILGRTTPWPQGVAATMRPEELTVPQVVELSEVISAPRQEPAP